MREMYVSGSTLFEGVESIEGSDWTDTFLRKDQSKYLCGHPTAKGTNPTTGVDTRERQLFAMKLKFPNNIISTNDKRGYNS